MHTLKLNPWNSSLILVPVISNFIIEYFNWIIYKNEISKSGQAQMNSQKSFLFDQNRFKLFYLKRSTWLGHHLWFSVFHRFPRFDLIRFWFQSAVFSLKSKRCHAKQPKPKPPKSPEVWILNFRNFSQSLIMRQDRVILVADNPQWENIYLQKQLTTTNKPDHLKNTSFLLEIGLACTRKYNS